MNTTQSVGVIVGRFQVPELHAGHRHLIEEVAKRFDVVLIVLGYSGAFGNDKDPLSLEERERMIRAAYPDVWVRQAEDQPSNARWSETLDSIVTQVFPNAKVMMCGSRDSFLSVYSGKFATLEVSDIPMLSGSQVRESVGERTPHSSEFLSGIIYREMKRMPIVYQTVDIAVLRDDGAKVLLGSKKKDCGKLRFVGGFVDASDSSLELAAKRELGEEAPGIEADDLHYVASTQVMDHRYRGTKDCIMTTFFASTYIFGHTAAGDDLDALEWVPIEAMLGKLVPSHTALGVALLRYLGR